MKSKPTILETKKIGEELNAKEQKQLLRVMNNILDEVDGRRRMMLSHTGLQNTIGMWFHTFGFGVDYEVPFHSGGFGAEKVIFDVVAEKGRRTIVVEVKPTISSRDLGQVHGYMDTLQLNKFKADVFLGTDILNYSDLVKGTTGEMIKELMEREQVGIILADKQFMIIFGNYKQLIQEAMPGFWFSEEYLEMWE